MALPFITRLESIPALRWASPAAAFIGRLGTPEGGRALVKTALWFGAALVATAFIGNHLPAHPIVVQTNSIDTGVYWLDKTTQRLERGHYISFDFVPVEALKRYGVRRHAKMLMGLPGDVVKVDSQGNYSVCQVSYEVPNQPSEPFNCVDAGAPKPFDSQGVPLSGWLAPNSTYTLKANEFWAYAPNPKSLDSRYNGPVFSEHLLGRAIPVWLWKSHKDT